MGISRRLPSWPQVAQVYAVIVLMVYGWTIMWFLWKVPSWLAFLSAGEMLAVLAYALAANLIESLAVLCVPVCVGIILPQKWFNDAFVARAAALMLAGIGASIFVALQFKDRDVLPSLLVGPWRPALMLLGIAVGVYLAGRFAILRRALELLADRATIFLYVSLPLSLLAMLTLAARWLR
ncbi:MAG TPA: hypothetical protein VLL49_02935 [Anaerolineales bacterium]|nr:hypothetical protein [Anaerolineales bacterium]